MKYDPAQAVNGFPAGEYEAVLVKVEEKRSKKGNDMLEVSWAVFNEDGREITVRDWIVNPQTLFKLKGIARAWGALDEFNAATFELESRIDQHITVQLEVQEDAQYGDRNVIAGYRAMPSGNYTAPPKREPAATAPAAEGDIPF